MKKDKYSGLGQRTKKRNKDVNSYPGGEGAISLPEGYEFYKPTKGRNKIEILPFVVGENHPDVVKEEIEIGNVDYVLDLWIHRSIGVQNTDVICPAYNYNEPCPICEEIQLMKDAGVDKEEYKSLYPKRRVIYNLYDHNDDKVKIFSVSHFLFAKELQEEVDANNEEGEIIFAHPKIGKTIKFRAVEKVIGKNNYFEFKSFEFEDRKEEIEEEVLNSTITLGDTLNLKNYDQIHKIFHAADDSEEDNESEEVKDSQKNKDKKYYEKIKEEQEDDKDDEKEKETKNNKKKNKCQFGYKFGIDTDNYDECNDCEVWDECDQEKHN